MAVSIARVERADKVIKALKKVVRDYTKNGTKVSVITGYTQKYALKVHETKRNYKVGQWKYLETPARTERKKMGQLAVQAAKKGLPLIDCLVPAGIWLQRVSQNKYCPVDTSALKASAFTAKEPFEVAQKAAQARAKSDAIRAAKMGARFARAQRRKSAGFRKRYRRELRQATKSEQFRKKRTKGYKKKYREFLAREKRKSIRLKKRIRKVKAHMTVMAKKAKKAKAKKT